MSTRANRLQPAADQARQRSEEAVQKLAEQQQALAKAERQLSELRGYRQEYAVEAGGGMSVSALLNRQQFVERIDRAIAQQLHEIERQRRMLEHARGQWREAHAREAALDSVIDRYREQERKSEERREQGEIDERMQHRRPARPERQP
ncbi:flagellar export protein FliJ [Frateuria sp. Soil773]|uniref:flagellar export protein FliJ n=1 Tax=Frateuria sp. Soil773 TaxID=1736407 RepID=UPI0006F7A4D7|nr:flagellar export protein FliJ [Frateuria sp. Soil773]KRE90914.1 flagellar export protein FliJ [Frateuria sp. Soil773]